MLKFPLYAQKCIDTIENNGYEAYFVGGCVRDTLLGRAYGDIDVTTNALPQEIIRMFPHTALTGLKHGTVTAIIDDIPIEITTYRSESGYSDLRHPDKVTFVNDIYSDLSRRDFTVNAIAYNPHYGICDPFDGCADLKNGIIRTVGNPQKRFSEDALRILRAYRFASVLDFKIEKSTLRTAEELSHSLSSISGERILAELKKASCGKSLSYILDLFNCEALNFCGVGKCGFTTEFISICDDTIACENKLPLLISLTSHNTELIKKVLKPDNRLLKRISFLDGLKDIPIPKSRTEIKKLLSLHGIEYYTLFCDYHGLFDKRQKLYLTNEFNDIMQKSEPFGISQLKINGRDLLALGLSGNEISTALNTLLDFVIAEPSRNDKGTLLSLLKK